MTHYEKIDALGLAAALQDLGPGLCDQFGIDLDLISDADAGIVKEYMDYFDARLTPAGPGSWVIETLGEGDDLDDMTIYEVIDAIKYSMQEVRRIDAEYA